MVKRFQSTSDFQGVNFYDDATPLNSEFVVQEDGLSPGDSNDSLSAKGALLSALTDAGGFTAVIYFNMPNLTDKTILAVYNNDNGTGGAHSFLEIGETGVSGLMLQQTDGSGGSDGFFPGADEQPAIGSIDRVAVTFTPTETSVSVHGATVQTTGGVTRPYAYDRADIGNKDSSQTIGGFHAGRIAGIVVYAPLDAAMLPSLNPLTFE